jgi:hypothetical protein
VSVSLDQVVTGLGLLGNVLSLPNQVQNQQIQNEQTRAMLQGSGIPDDMIKAATPEPMMRWLSPQQGGFTGHVLGGVGDVGSILSTIVGKPVAAPRMTVPELAEASKLRVAHAQALAKDDLGRIIMDPKSTKRDIAGAAIKAGSTDQALRLMRGGDEQRPPASILGLRSTLESMDPDDPRRPGYQRALDAQLAADKQRRDEENQAILDRQPPHYDPAQTYQMRHEAEQTQRGKEADQLHLTGDDRDYYMSYGHKPIARQAKAEPTYEEDYATEQRRRDALARNALTMDQVPNEPVDVTVRRNRAARAAGKGAEKAGAPLPDAPPPPPGPEPGTAAYQRQLETDALKGAPAAGTVIGKSLGGKATAPQGPPGPSPTLSPPPPSDPNAPAPDSDAALDAYLHSVKMEQLPPDVRQQVQDAADAGMNKWALASWLQSLTSSSQPPATASPAPQPR